MATGKVKTLYSDKEKSEALFPRTKTSAISDANGVGLDALLENLLYSGIGNPEAAVALIDADTLGGIPADDYATKNDVASAVSAIDFPVDSVNGKTGVVSLTASDVGAAPTTHYHNQLVMITNNGNWKDAPAGLSYYRYEGAVVDTPSPTCYVMVMKEGGHRGTAIAFEWAGGNCTMWRNTLHDDTGSNNWRGWVPVPGSGNGIVPVANGGTGAADAASARAYLGLTPYFRAYYLETSASSEVEMLQYNWKDWDMGAFLVFYRMGGNYRGLVGMKVDNTYGAAIELAYGTGSIYKYRLNGGTWTEHHHAAH